MDDSGELRLAPRHVAELSDFFAAHDRWLFGHACVRTRGDRELAADLVQDTFEAAARTWAVLRGHGGGRQRAWLLGTLANKDVSQFRRQEAFRRRQPDIQARYQATAADTAAEALNAIALDRAREIIAGMPPRQRACALTSRTCSWPISVPPSAITSPSSTPPGTTPPPGGRASGPGSPSTPTTKQATERVGKRART
jgi:DNA-directed RNA polymerase specialized sigma24 family protein